MAAVGAADFNEVAVSTAHVLTANLAGSVSPGDQVQWGTIACILIDVVQRAAGNIDCLH